MNVREQIGKITLQENVNPMDKNKIPNTFVVHVPNPLATYYTRFSEINRPNSVLFLTKKSVSYESILRSTKKINEEKGLEIRAAKCELNLGSRKHSGIRVKGITRYSHIEDIQRAYLSEGFEFAKNIRLQKDNDAIIRVNKFFNLKFITDGIYQSPYNSNRYYIIIPKQLTWDEFRDLTIIIKNNIPITNFDIAKGILYDNSNIIDMLRVIKPNITLDMVKTIQQKYLEKLS